MLEAVNFAACSEWSPLSYFRDAKDIMELVSKASDSFCDGDLVAKAIRSNNSWGLLPTQAIFASVIPGEFMSGHMKGQINFPSWFGKYSKTNKIHRFIQELQAHTRLRQDITDRVWCQRTVYDIVYIFQCWRVQESHE